jgi:hypothetical protein
MHLLFCASWATVIFVLGACGRGGDQPEERESARIDSQSRISQKRIGDSMKLNNPLLIVPPDSAYTGTYVDRYPNGIVKFSGYFRFGKRHGQWMSFFPNGEKWSEMHYDKGQREGPNMVYYKNNRLLYAGMYKHDLQDSIWEYYDSTGAMVTRLRYREGKVIDKLSLTPANK